MVHYKTSSFLAKATMWLESNLYMTALYIAVILYTAVTG